MRQAIIRDFDRSKNYCIYILVDPRTEAVRYVGKTGWAFQKRFIEHLWTARATQATTPRYEWMRELLATGEQPRIDIIDWCETEKEAYQIEREWIECYRQLGAKLTNRIPQIRKKPRLARVSIPFDLYQKMKEEFGPGALADDIRRIIRDRYKC